MALKPATAIEPYVDLLPELDMLLLMTSSQASAARRFLDAVLPKIRRARRRSATSTSGCRSTGASPRTIEHCAEAGADVFVAGTAVYGAADPAEAIRRLRAQPSAPRLRHGQPCTTDSSRRCAARWSCPPASLARPARTRWSARWSWTSSATSWGRAPRSLRQPARRGWRSRRRARPPDGTVVVTLEPCNHTGRTRPCTAAARGRDARVVVGAARPVRARRRRG